MAFTFRTQYPWPAKDAKIGEMFMAKIPLFILYSEYVLNRKRSMTVLEEQLSANRRFVEFLEVRKNSIIAFKLINFTDSHSFSTVGPSKKE